MFHAITSPVIINTVFDATSSEIKVADTHSFFYDDIADPYENYCVDSISFCSTVDEFGVEVNIPNLRVGDVTDKFSLYVTQMAEGQSFDNVYMKCSYAAEGPFITSAKVSLAQERSFCLEILSDGSPFEIIDLIVEESFEATFNPN